MTIEKKLLGTNPSGGGSNVADVFSTYLYKGTGAAHTITNGIDLAGEGGMVWTKDRSTSKSNAVFDTERGATKRIQTDKTQAEITSSTALTSFNSNGFTVQDTSTNESPDYFVSWTFRKAPKFFDVITYSGNSVAGREIAHGIDGAVGMLFIKSLTASSNWLVQHKSIGGTKGLRLNETNAAITSSTYFNDTLADDSVFTLGTNILGNNTGETYVAYLFADNTAEDADDQMIKCGSYTGNGSAAEVNLGWEPQFILQKKSSGSSNWIIYDSMRGIATGGDDAKLYPNTSDAENSNNNIDLTSTGFIDKYPSTDTWIYMAIRAPMMKEPSAGTEVFSAMASTANAPWWVSGFPVDMAIWKDKTSSADNKIVARITGKKPLKTNTNEAEGAAGTSITFDYSDGWSSNTDAGYPNYISWMWKRAKGYMDCVVYSGSGVAGRTVAHSLGVVPEMIWVKNRDVVNSWFLYFSSLTNNQYMVLNGASPVAGNTILWNDTSATTSAFSLGTFSGVNGVNNSFIAYLFATLAGISKCGSYVGNGSYQTISCGFSAGSRFVLIKRTDANGDWYFWDTTRGIVAGNDPHLSLNTTAAQVSDDSIDPANSGFSVNQISATNINVSSGTYIFYAIA